MATFQGSVARVQFELDIRMDADAYDRAIRQIQESSLWALDDAVRQAADEAQIIMQIEAPVDTGTLRASIRTIKREDAWYAVGPTVDYAFWTVAANPPGEPDFDMVTRELIEPRLFFLVQHEITRLIERYA